MYKDLVVGREGWSEATLRRRKELVLSEVLVDTTGNDGFKDLAKHGGETDGTVGRGLGWGLVGFGEHEDAGDFPQARIETGIEDSVVEGGKDSMEGEGTGTEVPVGEPVVTGSGVAFGIVD